MLSPNVILWKKNQMGFLTDSFLHPADNYIVAGALDGGTQVISFILNLALFGAAGPAVPVSPSHINSLASSLTGLLPYSIVPASEFILWVFCLSSALKFFLSSGGVMMEIILLIGALLPHRYCASSFYRITIPVWPQIVFSLGFHSESCLKIHSCSV